MSRFRQLIDYLKKHQLVLATAESCTAGEIMSTLAKEGDCGNCLFIGYVVYSEAAKKKQLGVKAATIEQYTLTSEAVAKEMAQGVFQHSEINLAIATTGILGDKPMDGIPPGTVCFAWGFRQNETIRLYSETRLFTGSLKELPKKAACYALDKIQEYHQQLLQKSN